MKVDGIQVSGGFPEGNIWCTRFLSAAECSKISHQIDFNCRKIRSVVPEILLVHQIFFCRRMLKHFARDRFQLQENPFWCNCNRSFEESVRPASIVAVWFSP